MAYGTAMTFLGYISDTFSLWSIGMGAWMVFAHTHSGHYGSGEQEEI